MVGDLTALSRRRMGIYKVVGMLMQLKDDCNSKIILNNDIG